MRKIDDRREGANYPLYSWKMTVLHSLQAKGVRKAFHKREVVCGIDLEVKQGEIVDVEEKIKAFLPIVDEIIERVGCGAMMTIEKAEIIKYTHGK